MYDCEALDPLFVRAGWRVLARGPASPGRTGTGLYERDTGPISPHGTGAGLACLDVGPASPQGTGAGL